MPRPHHSTPTPPPDNVIDPADLTVCSFCGQTYDGSWADLSFFHSSNHTITDAPHVSGERIDDPARRLKGGHTFALCIEGRPNTANNFAGNSGGWRRGSKCK